jgi:hypothetical protein
VRRRPFLAAAGLYAGIVLAVVLGLVSETRPASASREARIALLRVDVRSPAWLAPGGGGRVAGWAEGRAPVRLETDDGVVLAQERSGVRGRFSLAFRAPGPGRYRLRVVTARARRSAGTLVVRPLTLDAVGDITFGEQVGPAIARYGPAYPWTGVAATLRGADVTTGNLETAVSERGVAAVKQYVFRGTPGALPPLSRRAGFDVLTLANNHAGDYGPAALLDTVAAVRAAGIQPIGAGADELAARRPAVVRAGGLRIAFLGYSDVNPLGFPATATTPGTARADPAAIAADVRASRRRADLVVCFFHWGVELRPEPDARQQELARACLAAGAQVVLGAHPHVFGPVTQPTRRSLVAWTLGNFVFPSSGATAQTAILQVRLDARGVHGYRLIPVRIDGFVPRLAP